MAIANDHFLCVKRANGTVLKLRGNTTVPYTGRYIAFKVGGVTRYVTCSPSGGILRCSKRGTTLYANNITQVDITINYQFVQISPTKWQFTLYGYTVSFLDGGFTENARVKFIALHPSFYERQHTLSAGTAYVLEFGLQRSTTVSSSDPSESPVIPVDVSGTVFGIPFSVYNSISGTTQQPAHFISNITLNPS